MVINKLTFIKRLDKAGIINWHHFDSLWTGILFFNSFYGNTQIPASNGK